MAVLKHIASKNADYSQIMDYMLFQHDEFTMKPVLDENGRMVLREEYYIDGINCEPMLFDKECEKLNAQYHKNQNYDDIKSHHYILSFDPKDKDDHGLTGEQAQALGMEYAKKNFPGHQALVCTHMDGHNGSGNIHVHIIINSLRKLDVEQQPFMERPCDSRAGYKHHLTDGYLRHLQQSVMDMCHRENLYQVDLLSPSKNKITQKEYWAARRGQGKLNKRNEQIVADGMKPRRTLFQTQKHYLRTAGAVSAISTRNVIKTLLTGRLEPNTAGITFWRCLNKISIPWKKHRPVWKQNLPRSLLEILQKTNTVFLNTIRIMTIPPIRLPSCLSGLTYDWSLTFKTM